MHSVYELSAHSDSQEELITLAATLKSRFGKSRMADAINAGLCLHSFFAAKRDGKFQGINIDNLDDPEVIAKIKEITAPYKVDDVLVKHRQQAKVANFGLGADMQLEGFYINCRKQGVSITKEEAEALRNDWFNTWPEMDRYKIQQPIKIAKASEYSKKKGKKKVTEENQDDSTEMTKDDLLQQLEEPTVKRYEAWNLVGIHRGDASRQAALNFPFQSLAAVVSKLALWLVYRDSLKRGYKLVAFIHDEIIVEAPREKCHEIATSMHDLMIKAATMVIPDVKMKAEYTAMTRWSKEVKAMYDSDGRLIPAEVTV